MLSDIVGEEIAHLVGSEDNLVELRMRVDKVLVAIKRGGERCALKRKGVEYVTSKQDIEDVISRVTNMSFYSASDEIMRGYIPFGKYRIGVCGEGISENGTLMGIKNISYLAIRIPHQIYGVADVIINDVLQGDNVRNTLIISPTGGGKTTMLRELARLASYEHNVVVIDERYELAAVSDGIPTLDIGEADVMSGVPKKYAYECAIRAMNPDIIVTDELFGISEVDAILDAMRCGVKVFASLHASKIANVEKGDFKSLLDAFECVVTLGKNPIGKVVEKRVK